MYGLGSPVKALDDARAALREVFDLLLVAARDRDLLTRIEEPRGERMITTLFLGFVALMAAVVVAMSARYLNGRTAFVITAGLFV